MEILEFEPFEPIVYIYYLYFIIQSLLTKILILFIFVAFYFLYLNNNQIKCNLLNIKYLNLTKTNKFLLSKYFKNINEINKINFNITSINFFFYINKGIAKTEFIIDFYDRNDNLIVPSDLTLYNKLVINLFL